MKQKAKIKRSPKGGLLRRLLPSLVVVLVATVGVWLLTASHADSLCNTVVDNKISFSVCPVVSGTTVATQVTARSHFFGLVPTKSLLSIQKCDSKGAGCANVITQAGEYADTGNAVYVLATNRITMEPGHAYKACAFVGDSTGWTGGACSSATTPLSVPVTKTTPAPTTTTVTPAPTEQETTPQTKPKYEVSIPTTPVDPATAPTTTPPVSTPTQPAPSTTKPSATTQKQVAQANTAAAKYNQTVQSNKDASTFLTALYNMCPDPKPTLSAGSTGNCVKVLQFLVNGKENAGLVVDGQFGPATQAAVLKMQRAHGLTANGIAANQTWIYLVTGKVVPTAPATPTPVANVRPGSSSNDAQLAKFYQGIADQQLAKFYQGIADQQLAKFYQGIADQQQQQNQQPSATSAQSEQLLIKFYQGIAAQQQQNRYNELNPDNGGSSSNTYDAYAYNTQLAQFYNSIAASQGLINHRPPVNY